MIDLGPTTYVLSGKSFIDLQDPGGSLGNPFTVIMGREVGAWTTVHRQAMARRSGTPETIFVNAFRETPSGAGTTVCEVALTVQTPTGQELGACAHRSSAPSASCSMPGCSARAYSWRSPRRWRRP